MSDADSDIDLLSEEIGNVTLDDVSKDLGQLSARGAAGVGRPLTRRKPREAIVNYYGRPETADDAFRIMMERHRSFFEQPILSQKEISVPDLVTLLIRIRDTERNDNSVRREYILQLLKTCFLEISGPVFATLQKCTKMNESSEVVFQCLDLLIDLLQDILERCSGSVDTFQIVMTLSSLMRMLPDTMMTTDLKTRLDTLTFSIQDTETIEKHFYDPDMTWSPDSSYIDEPIIPPVKDLLNSKLHPKYINLIKGPYQSKHHYIETWYRLMREDFLSPLRKAILEYRALFSPEDSDTLQGHTLDDGYHYHLKSMLKADRVRSETIYLISFSLKGLDHVDWNGTDRLKRGTLLVLSNDHFESAQYALVSDNPKIPASKGNVWILTFEGTKPYIDNHTHAIEPKVFFESYRCVLERLRHRAVETERGAQFPFERYLVKCNKEVNPPSYLPEGTTISLTEGFTVPDRRIEDSGRRGVRRSKLLRQETGKINDCGVEMDKSQMDALNHALTHKVAIIQGPPGCGKSFIGSQLVKILMLNSSKWQKSDRGCILMLSFTNHAIDQFIGDCERSGTNMSRAVRIGSRGNRSTEKYLLRNKRELLQNQVLTRSMLKEASSLYSEINSLREQIKNHEDNIRLPWKRMDPPIRAISKHTISKIISNSYSVNAEHALANWCNDYNDDSEVDDENEFLDFENIEALSEQKIGEYENKLFRLNIEERKSLYAGWCEKMKRISEEKLPLLKDNENELSDQIHKIQEDLDIATIRRCNIVAMTTSGASKHAHLLKAMKPVIVLVEEAAEVLESHIVAPLTAGCKHLIMIGDHKQLRPSISEFGLEERNLSISLFERLILNDFPYIQLSCQHRMHPDISSLLVPHIYPELRNHPVVDEYPTIDGLAKRMSFLEHDHFETQTGEKASRNNPFEAQYLVVLCRYLLLQGYNPKDISIICTYAGQVTLIKQYIAALCEDHPDPLYSREEKKEMLREEFADLQAFIEEEHEYVREKVKRMFRKRQMEYKDKRRLLRIPRSKISDVLVTTVDNYQGEENKIILLSFVRSNKSGNIGFLKWANRICVALSRAKYGFYAVGNFKLFAKNAKSDLWRKLCLQMKLKEDSCLSDKVKIKCQKHGTIREIMDGPSLLTLSPHGGCDEMCGHELNCGHTCRMVCHLQDQNHELYSCTVTCTGKLDCGHTCTIGCHEPADDQCLSGRGSVSKKITFRKCQTCGKVKNCQEHRRIECLCGKEYQFTCSEEEQCISPLTFTLPCQHTAVIECHQRTNSSGIKCMVDVRATLPCGHKISVKCYEKDSIKCEAIVEFRLKCGHVIVEKCGMVTDVNWINVYKCEEIKEIDLDRCGHVLRTPCYKTSKGDLSSLCIETVMEACKKCKHQILRKCNEKPSCMNKVLVEGLCGHLKQVFCSERSDQSKTPCVRCDHNPKCKKLR